MIQRIMNSESQESVGRWLAWSLFATFGIALSFGFITTWFDHTVRANVKDLLTLALTNESARIGSAIGSYFGTSK
jgi:hypothetical protein